MARQKNKIPTYQETLRLTRSTIDKIKRIKCRSSTWDRCLTTKGSVVSFAIDFLWDNIDYVERKMK